MTDSIHKERPLKSRYTVSACRGVDITRFHGRQGRTEIHLTPAEMDMLTSMWQGKQQKTVEVK